MQIPVELENALLLRRAAWLERATATKARIAAAAVYRETKMAFETATLSFNAAVAAEDAAGEKEIEAERQLESVFFNSGRNSAS